MVSGLLQEITVASHSSPSKCFLWHFLLSHPEETEHQFCAQSGFWVLKKDSGSPGNQTTGFGSYHFCSWNFLENWDLYKEQQPVNSTLLDHLLTGFFGSDVFYDVLGHLGQLGLEPLQGLLQRDDVCAVRSTGGVHPGDTVLQTPHVLLQSVLQLFNVSRDVVQPSTNLLQFVHASVHIRKALRVLCTLTEFRGHLLSQSVQPAPQVFYLSFGVISLTAGYRDNWSPVVPGWSFIVNLLWMTTRGVYFVHFLAVFVT